MRATGLVAALALVWGSGYLWIKLALGGFAPLQLTFGRLALGAVVLLPIVFFRRLTGPHDLAVWGHLTVSAILACALPYTLFAIAEQSIPSSLAGVLNSTTPLWTILLASVMHTERSSSARVPAGILIGFSGVVVISEPWSSTSANSTIGTVACLAAALSYAIAYTYQGYYLTNRGIPAISLAAYQLAIAAAILAATLPFGNAPVPSIELWPQWVSLLILGVAGTGLALVLNFKLIASEGATAASVTTYLVPVVALALGLLALREPARSSLPMGAVLILIGVTLVRLRPRAPTRSTDS